MAASRVMCAKEPEYKNRNFLADNGNYDVLFFGSSHAENFFDPVRLWNEYGITSYNFGNPEEPLPVTYWVIANSVRINKPSVVVVDTFMFDRYKEDDYSSYFHYALDSFPMNEEKIAAINDLSNSFDEKLDKVFTISTYHSRWKTIGKAHQEDIDYYVKGSLSYGHPYTMNVVPFDEVEMTDDKNDIDENNTDIRYINKIIDLCNKNSIELIFVSTPFHCYYEEQKEINTVEAYIKSKGIPFLNYNRLGIIDMSIDMYNVGHVNQAGLKKVTSYFGDYLIKNYSLPRAKTDKQISDWEEYSRFYDDLKLESFWQTDNYNSILMLLSDDSISFKLYVSNPYDLGNDTANKLIQNIDQKNVISNIDTIKEIADNYGDFETDDSNMVLILCDKYNDEVRLIKKFYEEDDIMKCENLYSDIKTKILF